MQDITSLINLEFNVPFPVIEMAEKFQTDHVPSFNQAVEQYTNLYKSDGAFKSTNKETILRLIKGLIKNCPGYHHPIFQKLREKRRPYSRGVYVQSVA
jgi:hypothetical protein